MQTVRCVCYALCHVLKRNGAVLEQRDQKHRRAWIPAYARGEEKRDHTEAFERAYDTLKERQKTEEEDVHDFQFQEGAKIYCDEDIVSRAGGRPGKYSSLLNDNNYPLFFFFFIFLFFFFS